MISGIRLLDKSASGRESMFRIEIWTKFNSSNESMVSDLRTHLEENYIAEMMEDSGTKSLKRGCNEEVASDWIEAFKNLGGNEDHNSRPAQRGPP